MSIEGHVPPTSAPAVWRSRAGIHAATGLAVFGLYYCGDGANSLWATVRNTVRAGCGPLCLLLEWAGMPNDLFAHALLLAAIALVTNLSRFLSKKRFDLRWECALVVTCGFWEFISHWRFEMRLVVIDKIVV